MTNKIGFSNFRKFANFPEINLGDVTILVGGNNSGKSTLVKALLLCVDNLCNMRISDRHRGDTKFNLEFTAPLFCFDNEDVKIRTFARAIHNVPVQTKGIGGRVKMVLPTSMTFKFSLGQFDFEFVVAGNPEEEDTVGDVLSIVITDNARKFRYTNNYEHMTMSFDIIHDGHDESKTRESLLEAYESIDKEYKEAVDSDDLDKISSLMAEKDKIASAFESKYNVDIQEYIDGKHGIVDVFVERTQHFGDYDLVIDTTNPYQLVAENVIANIINFATVGGSNASDDEEYEDYRLDLPDFYEDNKAALRQEVDKMRKSIKDLNLLLSSFLVEYIPAHSVTQNTLYNTADNNDYIAKTVHTFYREKIVEGEPEYEFVRKWMKDFSIGEDFRIIPLVPGEAYQVDILHGDSTKVPLADMGMGSIQMMVLLLRLATILRRGKGQYIPTTIVIEEPEQNLHPKVQSLLACLFESMAQDKEHKVNFIIETHSEYLIRKTQVLVANADYADNKEIEANCPFVVYYLPTDAGEPYQMHYKTTGGFAEKFGAGFFDAATESDMVIIRKEFEQKKKNRK